MTTPPETRPGSTLEDKDLSTRIAELETREVASTTVNAVAFVVAAISIIASIIAIGFAVEAGTGKAGATAGVARTVAVQLSEFKISPEMIMGTVGDTLQITNVGTVAHNLTIEGTSISTQLVDPGKSTTVDTTSLQAGNYTVSCNVPGHKAAGMQAMLMLAAGGGASSAALPTASTIAGLTPAEQADGLTMPPAAMEAAMKSSTTAFPAKTAGVGGQDLAPTVLSD